jgi:molybdopterin-guanine dinucleotide biosynthesis protein A
MAAIAPLLGLVLAGGQSRRMGSDKAALEIDGITMLDRAVNTLKSVVPIVYVSVGAAQSDDQLRNSHLLIEDRLEDVGPAAGILAAHLHSPESAWLVAACDMPLLNREVFQQLIKLRDPEQDATAWALPESGLPEPLCAIYEPGTLAAFLEQVTAGGDPGPRAWLTNARTQLLTLSSPDVLAGANTPEELTTLMKQINDK